MHSPSQLVFMRFKQLLQAKLSEKGVIPKELLDFVPRGFQDLNHRIILKLHPKIEPYAAQIAEYIPQILQNVEAIWNRKGEIEGQYRKPAGLVHLWGDHSTEVIIIENNVRYKFDFTKIMFAKGNATERNRVPKKVQEGEIIIDMFTGIGYFSLGMAKTRRPKIIYSIEWNPTAFHYLQENIRLNKVSDIIKPIFGDCREIVPKLANEGIFADRIIMGLLPAPTDAIPAALSAVKPEGTLVIYEGIDKKESTHLFDEFSSIASKYGYICELQERRIVKNYKPHEYHIVVEIFVIPQN
ncbi:class I SAM-dependent methyltransferase [Candidatus Harpocratesius sp.]